LPPVYYVRTDFRDAFTNIEQHKLLAVVEDRIKVNFGNKLQIISIHSVDVVKICGYNGTVHCKKRKFVDGLPIPDFPGGSLVFYENTLTAPLARIWNAVRKCVRYNAVQRSGREWIMTRGIVQGDRLSIALCDLLLADLQATCLKNLVGCSNSTIVNGRVYRFVDDYVFVSYDQIAVNHFLATMSAGFIDYGLQLNRSKTETNLEGGPSFKFLGFQFNSVTGEVIKDNTSHRNRRPLHYFDYGLGRGRPGRVLYARMTGPNQHAVPVVLINKLFNSADTVIRNLTAVVTYKAFAVITAVKQYFLHLNPAYVVRIVQAVARLMYAKICGRIQYTSITPMQCKWIVYEVYFRMFNKYFSAENHCILLILHQIRNYQIAAGRKCNTACLKIALRNYNFTKMFG